MTEAKKNLAHLVKTGYNVSVTSNHLSIYPQDVQHMYRKIISGKPLELITNAIASLGFSDEKVAGKLPVLIQGMALPEFGGKMSDFERTHMPGRKACTRFPGQEAADVKDILQRRVWEAVGKERQRCLDQGMARLSASALMTHCANPSRPMTAPNPKSREGDTTRATP
jgi:hypothetical protein